MVSYDVDRIASCVYRASRRSFASVQRDHESFGLDKKERYASVRIKIIFVAKIEPFGLAFLR